MKRQGEPPQTKALSAPAASQRQSLFPQAAMRVTLSARKNMRCRPYLRLILAFQNRNRPLNRTV